MLSFTLNFSINISTNTPIFFSNIIYFLSNKFIIILINGIVRNRQKKNGLLTIPHQKKSAYRIMKEKYWSCDQILLIDWSRDIQHYCTKKLSIFSDRTCKSSEYLSIEALNLIFVNGRR